MPRDGAIAQLGERLLCKQEVVGSIPSGSTSRDHRASCAAAFYNLVREKRFRLRGVPQGRRGGVLSDIVKRRSIRAFVAAQAARGACDPISVKLDRVTVGSIL
jgi:hypothetical protein